MKTMRFAACAGSLALLAAIPAGAVTIHRLDVASPLVITDAEVKDLAREMTAWMAVRITNFAWDVACPDVVFIPGGPVRKIDASDSGTYDALVKELRAKAPGANVMFVSNIEDCSGVPGAIGCGAVGDEPFVVVAYRPYDSLLWLHERGHNVGLGHAGIDPAEQNVEQRIMYPSVSETSVGKTGSECGNYVTPPNALVSVEKKSAASAPAAALAPAASSSPAADGDYSSVVDAMRKRIADAREKSGLTKRAYEVVALPWVHQVPVEAIRQLDDNDLKSVRGLFDKPLNPFQVQAIRTLSIIGNADDVALIEKALKKPMPAVSSDSEAGRQALRTARQIKLVAPEALGLLASRTKSTTAIETLKETADLGKATTIAGPSDTLAADISRHSIKALNLANTAATDAFVKSALNVQSGTKSPKSFKIDNKTYTIAPLTADEVKRIKNVSEEIKKSSVDIYFKDSQ